MSTGSGCLPFILAEHTLIWPIWEWLFYHYSFDVLDIFIDCGLRIAKNAFSINLQLSFCADQSTKLSSDFALSVSSLQHPAHGNLTLAVIWTKLQMSKVGKISKKKLENWTRKQAKQTSCWWPGPFYVIYLIMHFLLEHDWFSAIFLAFTLVDSAVRGLRAICPSTGDAELYVAREAYVHTTRPACVFRSLSRCIVSTCRAPVFLSEAAAVGGSGYQQLDWPHPCVHAAPV